MSHTPTIVRRSQLPPDQQAIRDKCFHPTGTFVEFPKEEIEQSIPERFEKIVRLYPDRIAVKTANQAWTYAELNGMATSCFCETARDTLDAQRQD
jgi:non-ribosomal peptide synthetase component F